MKGAFLVDSSKVKFFFDSVGKNEYFLTLVYINQNKNMHHSQLTAAELLLDDSFLQYCKGTADANVTYWQQVQAQNPEVEKALELYRMMQLNPSASLKANALHRLEDSLDAGAITRRMPWKWMAAAAAVLTGIASYLYFHESPKPVQFKLYAQTDMENRRHLTLPDGSTVVLSTASSLQLGNDFNKDNRHVRLKGEAYFDVKPNASLPFIVVTDQSATTVLGTAFKVRSYTADEKEEVMLASGKVKVQAHEQAVELQPGEEAIYSPKTGIQKKQYRKEELQLWLQRKVIFEKADLNQIIGTLEAYYGLKVRLENRPTGAVLFTGVFNDQQPEALLDAISFTNNFTYRLANNEVVIRF